VLGWETTSYQDEQSVSADEAALAKALASASHAASSGSSHTSSSSSGSAASSGSGSGASHGAAAAPATAQQLAADQASVDAATAAQQAAQQNVDEAKLLSPEAGTIEAVTLTSGDQVSANSTAETIVISSPGGEEVVTTVPVTSIASVQQGEQAVVTPDGSATSLTGTVTSIGVMPSSGTSVSYPVTIVLNGGTGLPDGSSATVSLVTSPGTGSSIVVPTSAITAIGGRYLVRVDNHGQLSTVLVQIGASGPIYTQITSGLKAGQQVVVADLNAQLPTGNTNTRGFGGGGAFTGGGGAGGGGAGGGGAGGGAVRRPGG
jgi:trimeric autotransporter adhesin